MNAFASSHGGHRDSGELPVSGVVLRQIASDVNGRESPLPTFTLRNAARWKNVWSR